MPYHIARLATAGLSLVRFGADAPVGLLGRTQIGAVHAALRRIQVMFNNSEGEYRADRFLLGVRVAFTFTIQFPSTINQRDSNPSENSHQ